MCPQALIPPLPHTVYTVQNPCVRVCIVHMLLCVCVSTYLLDVLMEAEQLVSSTGAGVVLLVVAVLPVELVCVSMDAGLTKWTA